MHQAVSSQLVELPGGVQAILTGVYRLEWPLPLELLREIPVLCDLLQKTWRPVSRQSQL